MRLLAPLDAAQQGQPPVSSPHPKTVFHEYFSTVYTIPRDVAVYLVRQDVLAAGGYGFAVLARLPPGSRLGVASERKPAWVPPGERQFTATRKLTIRMADFCVKRFAPKEP